METGVTRMTIGRAPWGLSQHSTLTPPEERGRGRGRDNRDLRNVIHDRDARGWIENWHRERERNEQRDDRGYDYYGPFYDQPHRQRSPEGGHILGGVKAYSRDLKRVRWPLYFKTLGIEKYDGSTNPFEWLEVHQLAIEATGGDSYVVANYLLVCLSSSASTWLLGLPVGLLHSWNDLCRVFTSNLCATCAHLVVDYRDGNSGMGTRYPPGTRPDGYGYGDDFLSVGGTRTRPEPNRDGYGTCIFFTRG
jgi:hypothetical protein